MPRVIVAALAALLSLLHVEAQAQAYPSKPIRFVIPFGAGSATDALARIIGQELEQTLGQPIIVVQKPGADGALAAGEVKRAAPDGYSLMLMTSSHVLSPLLYAKVNFDPLKDFVPVTMITRIPSLMVVPPSSPAKSVMEFVALAKSSPGKLNYGSGGAGSLAHLSAEAFRLAAGIDYLHVPYKGAPDIVLALLSKQIDVGFPTMPTAFRPAQQGTLRALAVTSAKRTKVMPDVPTLLEAMPDGFALDAWLALVAPAGTPPAIVARLYGALAEGLKDPAFRSALDGDGSEVVFNSPAEFAALLKDETAKWQALIKRVGVKLD